MGHLVFGSEFSLVAELHVEYFEAVRDLVWRHVLSEIEDVDTFALLRVIYVAREPVNLSTSGPTVALRQGLIFFDQLDHRLCIDLSLHFLTERKRLESEAQQVMWIEAGASAL